MSRYLLSFKIPVLFILLFCCGELFAANYYWVNGSGSWSDYSNHWATTSGGATFRTQVPTSNDNVYFDANSFSGVGQSVSVDQTIVYCKDMNWTGVTNNPTLSGSSTKKIDVFGSLTFVSGMNITFTGKTNFSSNNSGNTITTAGKVIPADWYFDGVGGVWTLQDNLTFASGEGIYYFYAGTLNTNGQTVTLSRIWTSGSSAKVLNLSSSTINLVGSFASWYTTSSSFTINPGSSLINIIGEGSFNFYGGGKNYYDVNFQASTTNARYNNTFNNLTFNAGKTVVLGSGYTQTVNGSLTAVGNCNGSVIVKSSSSGSQATISKSSGSVVSDFISLTDIRGIGGASFTANNAIDGGGNSGWTINLKSSANFYWIGNSGNWDDGNHWSYSSGGPAAGCIPSSIDDVFFDANSFSTSGRSVTINAEANCRSMNWTGATNWPTLTGSTLYSLNIYGSLTLISTMSYTYTGNSTDKGVYFRSTNTGNTITTAGKIITSHFFFDGLGGAWTLQDNLTFNTGGLKGIDDFMAGTLNTNGQTVTLSKMWTSGSSSKVLNMGASTIDLVGTVASWYTTSASFTINPGTSTLNIIGEGSFNFYGGGKNYNNVVFQANTTNVRYNNNYNNLTFTAGKTVVLEAGDIQSVTTSLTAVGNCSELITVKSDVAGSYATIVNASGGVIAEFVTLTDIMGMGPFTANNSIDGGGNSGWTINGASSTDFYWIGNTGNWNDGNHWSYSSGGPAAGCVPSPIDDVYFDANSFSTTGRVVTINANANCRSMYWTGALYIPTLAGGSLYSLDIYGSLTLISGMNFTYTGAGFSGKGIYFKSANAGNTITTAGRTITCNFYFDGLGDWTLQDDLTFDNGEGIYYFYAGTLNTNDKTVNLSRIWTSGSSTKNLNLGASIVNLVGSYVTWYTTSSSFTVNPGTSTINIIGEGSFNFYGGGKNYYDVNFQANTSYIRYNNNYNDITLNAGKTVVLRSGDTQSMSGTLFATGTAAFPIEIKSSTPGSAATFSSPNDVCAEYLLLSDNTATGGGIFRANNSTDVNNNTGWLFEVCSIVLPVELLSFNGNRMDDGYVLLTWQTASEINNDFFTIERSEDGNYFEPIGIKQGAGNSNAILDYSFVDNLRDLDPNIKTVYYRLQQTDFDGQYKYSHIIAVDTELEFSITELYPNPARDYFEFSYRSKKAKPLKVIIYNALNKIVKSKEYYGEIINAKVPVYDLSDGLYMVVFYMGDNRKMRKLIISNGSRIR